MPSPLEPVSGAAQPNRKCEKVWTHPSAIVLKRSWAGEEETLEPGMTVSLVARRHGVAPNQLFTWRRLVAQGSLTAAGSGEEVVDYRALQNQVRELHRCIAASAAW